MLVCVDRLVSDNALGTIVAGTIAGGGGRSGRCVRVRIPARVLSLRPAVGEVWEITGDIRSTAYGAQIEATAATRRTPEGKLLVAFLAGRVPGIGPERAQRLRAAFGADLSSVLSDEGNVQIVADALGSDRPVLAARLAAMTIGAWRRASSEVATLEWLEANGLECRTFAGRLIRILGDAARSRLEENPYCLVALAPWRKVDELGLRILAANCEEDPRRDTRRLVGAVDAVVRAGISEGHTASPRAAFSRSLAAMLGGASGLAEQALEAGLQNGAVVPEGDLLRFPGCAAMEEAISSKLRTLREAAEPLSRAQLKAFYKGALVDLAGLHPEQCAAVQHVLTTPVACLLGGAGTGKTHTMRTVCAAWEALGGTVVPTALSGKAALRLGRATGRLARTLARLLGELDERARLDAEDDGDADAKGLARIGDRTLVVVDEASMVDLGTAHRLLRHVPTGARILFVGDDGQLPPISFGLLFHRLVNDTKTTSRLTVVHRQSDASGIPTVAAAIRERRVPYLDAYGGRGEGVSILPVPSNGIPEAVETIARDLGGFGSDALLVVTAVNDGAVGVAGLNRRLQEDRLSVDGGAIVKGYLGEWFAVGDPCIHLRNDYHLGLFNGSMGRVVAVEEPTRRVAASFDGRKVTFSPEGGRANSGEGALIDLALAYAVTCHKCQGSQVERVIIPLFISTVLDPSWLYTAITRAERQVVLVGSPEILTLTLKRQRSADVRCVGFGGL